MNDYFVYILECRDKAYYVGVTNNLERRLQEHQDGIDFNCFTFNKRPVELVFHQRFIDAKQAIAFEKQLKGWSRVKKNALIDNNWELLPELSKRRS